MFKKIISGAVCIIVFALILFNIKWGLSKNRRPCEQPNSIWVSDDNNIVITIDSHQRGRGIIKIDDKEIEFIFTNGPGYNIDLYSISAENHIGQNEDEHYENWNGNFVNKNKFIVTVKETTFFTVGDKIIFHKKTK